MSDARKKEVRIHPAFQKLPINPEIKQKAQEIYTSINKSVWRPERQEERIKYGVYSACLEVTDIRNSGKTIAK